MAIDLQTLVDTLEAVDLGLSSVNDSIIDNSAQFAFGVVDGMKLGNKAFTQPTLTSGEIIDSIEEDVEVTLMDRDRVLGMLAGALAVTSLLKGDLNITEGKDK